MIDIALKEWAATCRALEQGLQIILLRKGGLRDEEGSFHMDSDRFWLMPTYLHQDAMLVKPTFLPLLNEATTKPGKNDQYVSLHLWAEVVRTWAAPPENDDVLAKLPHIWTDAYLEIRRSFRRDQSILCAALRVFSIPQPHILKMTPGFLGCRSWVDLPELDTANSSAVMDDAKFAEALRELASQFEPSRT